MSFDDCNVHVNSPEVVPTALERYVPLEKCLTYVSGSETFM